MRTAKERCKYLSITNLGNAPESRELHAFFKNMFSYNFQSVEAEAYSCVSHQSVHGDGGMEGVSGELSVVSWQLAVCWRRGEGATWRRGEGATWRQGEGGWMTLYNSTTLQPSKPNHRFLTESPWRCRGASREKPEYRHGITGRDSKEDGGN